MQKITETIRQEWIIPSFAFPDTPCPKDLQDKWRGFVKSTKQTAQKVFVERQAYAFLYILGAILHETSEHTRNALWETYEKVLTRSVVERFVTADDVAEIYPIREVHPYFDQTLHIDSVAGTVNVVGSRDTMHYRVHCKDVTIGVVGRTDVSLAANNTVLMGMKSGVDMCVQRITHAIVQMVSERIHAASVELNWYKTDRLQLKHLERTDDMHEMARFAELILNASASFVLEKQEACADIEELVVPACQRRMIENIRSEQPQHMSYTERLHAFSFLKTLGIKQEKVTDALMEVYKKTTADHSSEGYKQKIAELKRKFKDAPVFKMTCAKCQIYTTPSACAESNGFEIDSDWDQTPIKMTQLFTNTALNHK
jgi:hypothetical protein